MPTWGELLAELGQIAEQHQPSGGVGNSEGPADILRRRYLTRLHEHTQRAVITYATAWYETRPINPRTLSVDLGDVRGFMEACSNIDGREVDLILHSPGGSPDAAESIMAYLRERFDHIRAVVPLSAMSAATMMALACDEVVMGAHSQLGPIDPQVTIETPEGPRSAPAQAIKEQFERAQQECREDPARIAAWMPLLRSLMPGLLAACDTAQKRTTEFVSRQLAQHMLADDPDQAQAAAEWFSDHSYFMSHGRQVSRDDARAQNITVTDLEDDQVLQDLVLSVNHATQLTFSSTPCAKLIENHLNRAWLLIEGQSGPLQLMIGPQQGPVQIPIPGPGPGFPGAPPGPGPAAPGPPGASIG